MTKPAELYACVYARELPAQAMLRLRPELREGPCVVMEGEPPLQMVCSCNTKARRLGVSHGMTRVEIDTFPTLTVMLRSHAEEATARAALLECASTFSPFVEDGSTQREFLCVIDIAGTGKLHGSPAILGRTLLDRMGAIGIASSIVIASNFHAAICLARGVPPRTRVAVIPPGEESTALSTLPLRVLSLSEERAERFEQWGIRTLGMLAALPEEALIARMGQEGKRLRRLACGALPHLFVPIEPVFALEEHIELDAPVELLESLLFVVGVMLKQLIIRATARVLALASVTVTLSLEGGASHMRTVKPALPSNDQQLWIKLLHLDFEVHPPNAAILSLRLKAEPGSTSKVQLGLFSPQLPEPSRLDVTLARIRAIVGEEHVGSPVLKDSHRPDDLQMEPFRIPTGAAKGLVPSRSVASLRPLRPAEDVTVTFREQRPVSFFFRQTRYDVERAYGPWLSGGTWWSATQWDLQHWDLVARPGDGALLCCCLVRYERQSGWKMVALYD